MATPLASVHVRRSIGSTLRRLRIDTEPASLTFGQHMPSHHIGRQGPRETSASCRPISSGTALAAKIKGGIHAPFQLAENLSLDPRLKGAEIHVRSDGAGSETFTLLPRGIQIDSDVDDGELMGVIKSARIASLRRSQDVIFGASVDAPDLDLFSACRPLVESALNSVGEMGKQPQAVAALHGLCDWVVRRLDEGDETPGGESGTLPELRRAAEGDGEIGRKARTSLEAVRAIATGEPRPGHSVLGAGTYRDGREAWEGLAREYAMTPGAEEVALYRWGGGEVVAVEYLADTSAAYLRSAGGSMIRLFFL